MPLMYLILALISLKSYESMSTVNGKTFEGENFRGFRDFSLNCKCFPMNYGLVNWQCKSTSMQL